MPPKHPVRSVNARYTTAPIKGDFYHEGNRRFLILKVKTLEYGRYRLILKA